MSIQTRDFHVIILAAGCSRRLAALTQDKPKSFLDIQGKRIIDYILEYLNERGFEQTTLVVGYLAEMFEDSLGSRQGGVNLEYRMNADFETTSHGYSLYLARDSWEQTRKPVLLLHADTFFHPGVLDRLLQSPHSNTMAVDETFTRQIADRPVANGSDGRLKGILVGGEPRPDEVGEVMCINRWDPKLMGQFFDFMTGFFEKNDRHYNWEPIFDAFLKRDRIRNGTCAPYDVHYEKCGNLPWININREADYKIAAQQVYYDILAK